MEYSEKQLNYYKKWGAQSQNRWRSALIQTGIFTCFYSVFYILIFEVGFRLNTPDWSAIYRPIITGFVMSFIIIYFQYRATKKKYQELQKCGKLDF